MWHDLRARGWQCEVGNVVQHERREQDPGRRSQCFLRQSTPRVRLEPPRHAGRRRAGRSPTPIEHGGRIASHLQRVGMFEHRRPVRASDSVHAQLGHWQWHRWRSGQAVHRAVGERADLRRPGRTGQVTRRIAPCPAVSEHDRLRSLRVHRCPPGGNRTTRRFARRATTMWHVVRSPSTSRSVPTTWMPPRRSAAVARICAARALARCLKLSADAAGRARTFRPLHADVRAAT
jgi:hypothetical protein